MIETVEGASLALEGVDDIHGGNGLATSAIAVGDRVADYVLEEHLENTASLFIDEPVDTLDTTTSSKTTDGRFGDSEEVATKYLSVTLGPALTEAFGTFTASGHSGRSSGLFRYGTSFFDQYIY
jgi:hypothetical protein